MRWTFTMTTGLVCLSVGLLAGYAIPRGEGISERAKDGVVAAKTPAVAPAPGTGGPSVHAAAPPPSAARAKQSVAAGNLLQSIPAQDDRSARDKWVQDLPPGEIPTLVAGLCADVGPGGLAYEDQNLIDEALEKWWKADSGALLNWLRRLPNGGTKRYLVSSLLKALARNDPARAAALAESFKAQDPGWNDAELQDALVSREVEEAWKRPGVTAEEMLQLYSRFSRGNRTSGGHVKLYPANFDFRRFLDGMAALNKNDGKSPAEMPSDTLEEWAKVDPQAAAQWFLESRAAGASAGRVSFAEWQDIASAISAKSGPNAYYQWAADIVAQPQQGKLRDLILRESSDADLVGILGSIADVQQRDAAVAEALKSSGYWGRADNIDRLAMISTPEARLKVIAQDPDRFGDLIKRGKIDPSLWPRAGLTAELVAAAISSERSPRSGFTR